jgi:2,5-dioxopentanoate dehydrogenase
MFADLLEDGSWIGARIDRGDPSRRPCRSPTSGATPCRWGPVVVFGASNFPYAFSTAGGDTASALAAGCPVVVKGHPAHPGTGELVAIAIAAAAAAEGVHPGVFAHLQGTSHELGRALVTHDLTAAVGFTGSLRAGRALFDAAAQRPRPIPVYAEMGSVNPVFVLPGALAERAEAIAEGLVASATLGVGQFCTNPGLVITVDGEHTQRFLDAAARAVGRRRAGDDALPGRVSRVPRGRRAARVDAGRRGRRALVDRRRPGEQRGGRMGADDRRRDVPRTNRRLADEVFGPSTLIVRARDVDELVALARDLDGQLTASVHATTEDLAAHPELLRAAGAIAGRIVFNAFPTGVEVTHAMHHGGPYPATTDVRSTSVGTAAIERFVRPVTYQDAPDAVLPPELA